MDCEVYQYTGIDIYTIIKSLSMCLNLCFQCIGGDICLQFLNVTWFHSFCPFLETLDITGCTGVTEPPNFKLYGCDGKIEFCELKKRKKKET